LATRKQYAGEEEKKRARRNFLTIITVQQYFPRKGSIIKANNSSVHLGEKSIEFT